MRDVENSPIPALRSEERWFSVREIATGIIQITEPHVHLFMRSNIWFIRGRDRDLLVDTGNGVDRLRPVVSGLTPRRLATVATHAHADHVGSLHEFDETFAHVAVAHALETADCDATLAEADYSAYNLGGFRIPPPRLAGPLIAARPRDFDPSGFGPRPARISATLQEGDVVDLGDRIFTVLHVPGHSPGCIALFDPATKLLISGDAIYDGPLVDDLHHSDKAAYRNSLARLAALDAETVLPGHGNGFDGRKLEFLIAAYLSDQ